MSNAGTPSMPLPYIGLRSDQGMVLLAAIAQADAQSGVEWLDRRIHIAECVDPAQFSNIIPPDSKAARLKLISTSYPIYQAMGMLEINPAEEFQVKLTGAGRAWFQIWQENPDAATQAFSRALRQVWFANIPLAPNVDALEDIYYAGNFPSEPNDELKGRLYAAYEWLQFFGLLNEPEDNTPTLVDEEENTDESKWPVVDEYSTEDTETEATTSEATWSNEYPPNDLLS